MQVQRAPIFNLVAFIFLIFVFEKIGNGVLEEEGLMDTAFFAETVREEILRGGMDETNTFD